MPYDVEKNFEYHPVKGSQPAAYAALRAKGKELAVLSGDGRDSFIIWVLKVKGNSVVRT